MDKLELYRWAVQDPETHAIVLGTMYERLRPGHKPQMLREDFAGTCADAVAWVALRRGRRAVAIDLDAPTIAWAKRRAERLLGALTSAVQFIQSDACCVGPPAVPPADIIAVLNYSIFYLQKSEELLTYLRQAREGLADNGILVLNLFGGCKRTRPGTTSRRVVPQPRLPAEPSIPPFDYNWEVRSHDAATKRLDCRIHFTVSNSAAPGEATDLRDAFRYDWRLWSVRELIDGCIEAGFSGVQVWRHTYDPELGEAGVFLGQVDPDGLSGLDDWTAYLVACR